MKLRVIAGLLLLWPAARQAPEAIPVRYAEGMVHGFLALSTADGRPLGDGDLLQVHHGGAIDARMTFHFRDSSTFDEHTVFTQRDVFVVTRYDLVQRGPAFERDLDATWDRGTGTYRVHTKDHDGREHDWSGRIDPPADTYNGLVIVIAKNLPAGSAATVHMLAFTPKPRLIGLSITPSSQGSVANGRRGYSTTQYTLKPELGALAGFFARLLGKMPPDSHAWIVTTDVPAFVRFEGPLYMGPVWRIDLTSPRFPERTP